MLVSEIGLSWEEVNGRTEIVEEEVPEDGLINFIRRWLPGVKAKKTISRKRKTYKGMKRRDELRMLQAHQAYKEIKKEKKEQAESRAKRKNG